jgi:hypothetical protein
MITLAQYVGKYSQHPDWTAARQSNAKELLEKVNKLEEIMKADGVEFPENPVTKSGISGSTFGGFRPQDCTIGAAKSTHKEGKGIDRFDPHGHIDDWCLGHQDFLRVIGIWLESPSATNGWSHWQSVAPKSGRRVFYP